MSNQWIGSVLKMSARLDDESNAHYQLPIGSQLVEMNQFIGKKISLTFTNRIFCIDTGKKIKKTYNQGYSYESFIKKAACDICIVKPELCHFDKGTCREPDWGVEHCFQPHIVYLSNASDLKVGITRLKQVPQRWIDQGATQAMAIAQVANRYHAGLIEVILSDEFKDKTNWRLMLQKHSEDQDLAAIKKIVVQKYLDLFDKYQAIILPNEEYKIHYPISRYPKKVNSLSFDKDPIVEGQLLGIKGQYLIFDEDRVLNMRKHQGYEIQFKLIEGN